MMSGRMSDESANKLDISPVRKNPKGKPIGSRQKTILINVYKDILLKNPSMKYNDLCVNLQQITGIGRRTIEKTISEYKKSNAVTSPNSKRCKKSLFDKIDDLDRSRLRQKVHSIWLRRELPTIDKILTAVNDDPLLPTFKRTTLYSTIKKMDFVFIKKKRFSVLTDREDLIVLRRSYLYNIRKYRRQLRTIYYLYTGDCVDRVWHDNTENPKHDTTNPTGKGKNLIVLHIGSSHGFLPGGLLCFDSKKGSGDFHSEMNGDIFREWFESILPRLDPNSIIVMDNAPYLSVQTEKYPTADWKKVEILEWLESKGIIPERPMLKPELLVIVRSLKPAKKSYIIDNLATNAGHTVLRLPPYHCEFNPIELAWAMVKGYVKRENTSYKIDDVQRLLNEAIDRVTPENWMNFIKHTIEEENKVWQVDDIMDELIENLEPCVLTITSDDESD